MTGLVLLGPPNPNLLGWLLILLWEVTLMEKYSVPGETLWGESSDKQHWEKLFKNTTDNYAAS